MVGTAGTQGPPEVTEALSEPHKETRSTEGKVRKLKLKLAGRDLGELQIAPESLSGSPSQVSVTSKEGCWAVGRWLGTLVRRGSGRAVGVRGHRVRMPTSVCIFRPQNNSRGTRLICPHFV